MLKAYFLSGMIVFVPESLLLFGLLIVLCFEADRKINKFLEKERERNGIIEPEKKSLEIVKLFVKKRGGNYEKI